MINNKGSLIKAHAAILSNTVVILLFCSNLVGCKAQENRLNIYDNIPYQKINEADSAYFLFTVEEFIKNNVASLNKINMYFGKHGMTGEKKHVSVSIARVFYSNDKLKVICWFYLKVDNDFECNFKDQLFHFNGFSLIGIRESIHKPFLLYPFDNIIPVCFLNKNQILNQLGQYYFEKMKDHQVWRVIQTGEHKGESELRAYEYNLQDPDFWSKCWIWERDSIGSNNLYPFQVRQYYEKDSKCFKCADTVELPIINYPEELLNKYK